MGVYIKIPNVTFTKYIGIAEIEDEPIVPDVPDVPDEPTVPDTYPVTDTLKGLYYLGGTQDETLVDHSGNGNNASVQGAVTYADGYATFTGAPNANRINTPIQVSTTTKNTIVALFRVPTGIRHIASNLSNSTTHLGFACSNGSVFVVAGGSTNNNFQSTINTSNFTIVAWSVDSDGVRVVRDVDGSVVEVMSKPLNVDAFTETLVIGGARQGLSWTADADIALVSIHEGDMTDEQLQQIFNYVRNKYAVDKGLTVE